jgi:hypothetical protein
VAAAINVVVIVFNVPLTALQIGALNAFALAVVGIVANSSDPTTVGTFTLSTQPPASK